MNRPSDPRDIITPDAFAVADDLLGRPLARPWRRGAAMLIDLFLIVLLANASGVFLGLAAAVVLFRVAFGRGAGEPRRGFVRTALGLIAAFVLFVTVVSGWHTVFQDDDRVVESPRPDVPEDARLAEGVRDRAAEPRADAPAAPPGQVRGEAGGEVRGEPTPPGAGRSEVDSLILSYAEALRTGDTIRTAELRPRMIEGLAGDRIGRLERRVRRLARANERLDDELERAREGPGILSLMGNAADELGIGFGWMGLYFTFFLAFWAGRTPGKRLLRIRVLRLDGKPITWWIALNRFGGYAASIFTGLLGFAEMFWDDNRQALQDRIAHTVVVRDRTDRAPGRAPNAPTDSRV